MEYSIVIRTIGKAGEKYEELLNSIRNLNIKPCEVLVVLPKGYDKPKERLGFETFVYSEKGMVSQRIYGGEVAKGEYILFVDDDVKFNSDFIEKMYKPIKEGIADVSVPAELSMLPPKHGLRKIIPMVSISACPAIFKKDMYSRIIKSGGWAYARYNEKNPPEYLYTHSAAGICFFTKKNTFININFNEDLWLQDTKYPLWEDQVMFYKFWIKKYKVVCLPKVYFSHLDAGKFSKDRNINAAYASSKNKYIFWYKYIYKYQRTNIKKFIAKIAIEYSLFMNMLILFIQSSYAKNKRSELKVYRKGIKDGKYYIANNK